MAGRRGFLQAAGGSAALAGLVGTGLLKPAHAVEAPRAAFAARSLADALRLIDAAGARYSDDIVVSVPEVAENGAAVPIDILSRLPGTSRLAVLVDDNPFPLALQLAFGAGVVPRVQTRLKMAGTTRLRVVATAGGVHYTVFREVKVILGGCGEVGDSR